MTHRLVVCFDVGLQPSIRINWHVHSLCIGSKYPACVRKHSQLHDLAEKVIKGQIGTNIGYYLGMVVTSLNDNLVILPIPN